MIMIWTCRTSILWNKLLGRSCRNRRGGRRSSQGRGWCVCGKSGSYSQWYAHSHPNVVGIALSRVMPKSSCSLSHLSEPLTTFLIPFIIFSVDDLFSAEVLCALEPVRLENSAPMRWIAEEAALFPLRKNYPSLPLYCVMLAGSAYIG